MKKFLVVDFEFTTYERPVGRPRGFFSEIIEIGAVKLDGEPLTDCGRIQSFVKPHFYPKDMQQAIEFPAMVQELAALYESGETYFVAWGTEDYKVLQTGCERHKIENPVKYEDYLDLALAYRLWKGDDYTTGLKKATEEQEVNTAGLWHTAFDDANNTGKLLIEMFNRGWKLEDFFAAREAYEAERAARQAERAKHHNGYRRW